MPDYDNTNRGVLFKNDRKVNEKHPDYTGKVNVGGQDYQLAAWLKTAHSGKTFMSLSVSEPYNEFDQRSPAEQAPSAADDFMTPPATKTKQVDDVVIEDIGDEPINLDDIPF